LHYQEKFNDGYDDYLPGEYVSQYSIEVIENEKMSATPMSEMLLCKDTKSMVGETSLAKSL